MKLFPKLLLGLAAAFTASGWAQSAEPIVVGQVVSMTTNGGDIGQNMRQGLQIYFDQVNAAGGVRGRPIKLVTLDDKYLPEETVSQTRTLIKQEHPVVLTGFRGTANTLALMNQHVLEDAGIPLVGVFSGAVEIRSSPLIYHTRTTFKEELKALARTTLDLGQTRVAVFYQDDAFGKSGLAALEEAAVTYGLDLVVKAAYDKSPANAERTVREATDRVLQSTPQAVILISVADQTYSFIQQLKRGGYKSSIYSLSVASPDRAVEILGKDDARGVAFSQVFPYLYSKGSPLINEYMLALQKFGKSAAPSYFSLEGFVNAKVVVEALRRSAPTLTSENVNQALKNLGTYDLGGFQIRFSPDDSQGSEFAELTILDRNGELKH
jgi:ABC-type branched-subunit amino acid transport system substrate-binding protein